jgi:hypothetical protein
MTSDRCRTILLTFLLAACADPPPGDEPRCEGEPYAPGATVEADGGARVTLLAADPDPPARFTNRWMVLVVDGDDRIVTAAGVTVTTFMPEHGHAGPPVTVTQIAEETLRVEPVELWMPGTWHVDFHVGDDVARFEVCVDE